MGVGVPNLQRAILAVKIQWIKAFLISLEKNLNLDVQNGLALPISTLQTQVMAKRRDRSQIGNLTPDH
jgi:hypothetical protein